jgi:PD-(D/E)XK endonuclease
VVRPGYHPRKQGDIGELSAMEWLASAGAALYLPFGHSPDVDVVADFGGQLVRVQVKTCGFFVKGRWQVSLVTRGGNQSWTGIVKHFTPDRADYVFAHVADGRRWFIPAAEVAGGRAILLGGPKYAAFEVEPGRPFEAASGVASLDSMPARRGSRAVKGVRL